MRVPVEMLRKFSLAFLLAGVGVTALQAQTSNRVWYALFGGSPTPSGDISVQSVVTDTSAAPVAAGTAGTFIAQTNFTAFNSPYDVVVDPAMGKVYVLDNNLQNGTPEYIYAFTLVGTPAQIAASAQVVFTMPVPAADVTAGTHPRISGLALDPVNHFLYFNQLDVTTSTNSYIGRLDLASSSRSDLYSSVSGSPAWSAFYVGQVPGLGQISLGGTNFYLGAFNPYTGNAGVYVAPISGGGTFSEVTGVSTNNVNFTNGLVAGVASDFADHLVYYLVESASFNNTGENAVWVYNTLSHSNTKITSGYKGFPNNLAVDVANGRYYFTVGQDSTGTTPKTNYLAVYGGNLGSLNSPTLLYQPGLNGQDIAGNLNAGNVVMQGIFVEDAPTLAGLSGAFYLAGGGAMTLTPGLVTGDISSTALVGATVAITSGAFSGDGGTLTAVTTGTGIAAAYNAVTETLTLSGSDTLANYQSVLRSVAFNSTNPDPTNGKRNPTRTISWAITDGGLASSPAASTLTLLTTPAPALSRMSVVNSSSGWVLLFTGTAGQNYVVQSAPALPGPWTDLSPVLTANSAGLIAYSDPAFPSGSARFYRVRTSQ